MDLVKARKKAKEAGRDESKPEAATTATGAAPAAPGPAPVPPAAPPPPPAAAAPAPPPPAAPPAEKKAKPAKAAKPVPPPAPEKPAPDDVFMDSAFGEDLPPLDDFDSDDDSMVIAPAPVRPSPPPAAKAAKPAAAEETDAAWEKEFERMQREHEREEQEKKQEPPRAARSAKPAEKGKAKEPARPQPAPAPEKKKPIAPLKIEEDWTVTERREAARPGTLEVDWDSAAPLFPGRADDDDFFSLVTEELYMNEFNREAETDLGIQLELLSFKLGQEIYAVRLTSIRQIIKLVPITMVPRAPDHILGILSLRGTIIPVFDLRRRLRLGVTEPTRKSRIIVVAEGRYMIGMIVDEVLQVVRLPETSLEPPPSMLATVESEFVEGIGRTQNRMLILLSLEKIMLPVSGGNR